MILEGNEAFNISFITSIGKGLFVRIYTTPPIELKSSGSLVIDSQRTTIGGTVVNLPMNKLVSSSDWNIRTELRRFAWLEEDTPSIVSTVNINESFYRRVINRVKRVINI